MPINNKLNGKPGDQGIKKWMYGNNKYDPLKRMIK